MSLGQGQETVAERALETAAKNGHWVILQVEFFFSLCFSYQTNIQPSKHGEDHIASNGKNAKSIKGFMNSLFLLFFTDCPLRFTYNVVERNKSNI